MGVRDPRGQVVTDSGAMVREASAYFKVFFEEREVEEQEEAFFMGQVGRRVPVELVEGLEAPLALKELECALRGMGSRRAPGIDGLPAEFYLRFWGWLGPVVLEVLQEVLRAGTLGPTMAKGVISLVFKKGEPTDLVNWRPLSMLCVDYKLLARVLAGRLREVMPLVVHADQTCGVAGRSARLNLQLIRDLTAWAEDRGLMVVGLDQAKVFDRVQWGFLFQLLGRLGFGQRLVGWLRTLYSGAVSVVGLNGHLGEPFRLASGVRQGCPLSPLLYVLYMEPLAAAIRADERVEGGLVPGGGGLRVKLSQYADDTTLLLGSDICLRRALGTFQRFGRAAGAELNLAKSAVKFFGRWKGREEAPAGLMLCRGPLKVLGVNFDAAGSATANWNQRLAGVQRKLSLWRARRLTFIGKVLVLKTDILPALLYLAYIFPMSASLRRPLVRMVFWFFVGGAVRVCGEGAHDGAGEGWGERCAAPPAKARRHLCGASAKAAHGGCGTPIGAPAQGVFWAQCQTADTVVEFRATC